MNDLTQMTYKILFLSMLAVLISLAMPAYAVDPGDVGGPGGPSTLQGRGAAAPLPVPDMPASPEAGLDTTPGDEVRSLDPAAGPADDAEPQALPSAPDRSMAQNQPLDGENGEKPWWKFW